MALVSANLVVLWKHVSKFKVGERAWYRPGPDGGPYIMEVTSLQFSSELQIWLYDIQHINAGWVHSGISEGYLDRYQ